ncbi:hypothetical protein KbCgl_02690 [Corynebacterium glutamicum]|nr:hypothetical protein KbCgl_02690 [Corynebacterium glutamicum]
MALQLLAELSIDAMHIVVGSSRINPRVSGENVDVAIPVDAVFGPSPRERGNTNLPAEIFDPKAILHHFLH